MCTVAGLPRPLLPTPTPSPALRTMTALSTGAGLSPTAASSSSSMPILSCTLSASSPPTFVDEMMIRHLANYIVAHSRWSPNVFAFVQLVEGYHIPSKRVLSLHNWLSCVCTVLKHSTTLRSSLASLPHTLFPPFSHLFKLAWIDVLVNSWWGAQWNASPFLSDLICAWLWPPSSMCRLRPLQRKWRGWCRLHPKLYQIMNEATIMGSRLPHLQVPVLLQPPCSFCPCRCCCCARPALPWSFSLMLAYMRPMQAPPPSPPCTQCQC